ncbi:MAG: hypothetical protein JWM16_3211 [Verrucomicrobiales bacterium]|nr:hypothetical protein [Verrucomicrobiales bacterium]
MKSLSSLCLALLIALGAAAPARAQEFRTDINPALLYYQSFLLAPDLPKADQDYLFDGQEWLRGQKLPERFGKLISYYGKQLRYARRAAASTVPCDWGIDLGPGPETLLPHLAKCKRIAQAGRLRAMWALQEGRPEDAREDLIACLALGRNSSRDGTLIAALVQMAVENIVCSTVAENYFQLPPETLKQLSDAIEAAPTRGTVATSIGTEEKSFFLGWFDKKVEKLQKENPGNETKVLAGIKELFSPLEPSNEGDAPPSTEPSVWERTLKAAGGTVDGILKLAQEMPPLYTRLAAVMALPQPEYEVQVKQFYAEVAASKNPLVPAMLAPLEKCRDKEFVTLAQLAMVHAAVEFKLHGQAGLKTVPDPCGNGPFAFERFVFEGVDRGFQLRSAYKGRGYPVVMIFVEKDGPAFNVAGQKAGQSAAKPATAK